MPTWVKVAIDAWTSAGDIRDGHVFRAMNRGDQPQGAALSEKVVWQLLQRYAAAAGVPGIAPHDLRRTTAKLCRAAGGELEQIQLLLGHSSVQTTERYLGTKQDLAHAPNDAIKLKLAGEDTSSIPEITFPYASETGKPCCKRAGLVLVALPISPGSRMISTGEYKTILSTGLGSGVKRLAAHEKHGALIVAALLAVSCPTHA